MLASDGDFFLGGDDLDRALAEVLAAECNRHAARRSAPAPGADDEADDGRRGDQVPPLGERRRRGRDRRPRSARRRAAARLPFSITRQQFEELIAGYVNRTIEVTKQVLVAAGIDTRAISRGAVRRRLDADPAGPRSGSPRCSGKRAEHHDQPRRGRRAGRRDPGRQPGRQPRRGHRHGRARCGRDRRRTRRSARPAASTLPQAPGEAPDPDGRQPGDARDPDRGRVHRAPARQERADPDRAHARVHDLARSTRPASRSIAAAARSAGTPRTSRSARCCSTACRPKPRGELKIEVCVPRRRRRHPPRARERSELGRGPGGAPAGVRSARRWRTREPRAPRSCCGRSGSSPGPARRRTSCSRSPRPPASIRRRRRSTRSRASRIPISTARR